MTLNIIITMQMSFNPPKPPKSLNPINTIPAHVEGIPNNSIPRFVWDTLFTPMEKSSLKSVQFHLSYRMFSVREKFKPLFSSC